MKKQQLIYKILQLHGVKPEYEDASGKISKISMQESMPFLDQIGISTDTIDDLQNYINKTVFEKWQRYLEPVQITKKTKELLIKVRIPFKQMNKEFCWVLKEENGDVFKGYFFPSQLNIKAYKTIKKKGKYFELDLILPINLEIGYHNLKIVDSTLNECTSKLIIAPDKCYIPLGVKDREEISALEFKMYDFSECCVNNFVDLGSHIAKLSPSTVDMIEIGNINMFSTTLEENLFQTLPSSKIIYNPFLINIDKAIDYLQDKSIERGKDYIDYIENLLAFRANDNTCIEEVFQKHILVLKQLYQFFREFHLNKNTAISSSFITFSMQKLSIQRKLHVFEALKESFKVEYPDCTSWLDWPESYKNPESEVVKAFERNNIELIQFYEFLQWLIDVQYGFSARISFNNHLPVGICAHFYWNTNPTGADIWANQGYYAKNFQIQISNDHGEGYCTPVLPYKMKHNCYQHFINALRTNMAHTGALKLLDIEKMNHQFWQLKHNKDVMITVDYPFEDLLSIIALESHRNKCMIITDISDDCDPLIKQKILQLGILSTAFIHKTTIKTENQFNDLHLFSELSDHEVTFDNGCNKPSCRHIHKAIIPDATYRLQFNKNFTFNDAIKIIPYLNNLGISHIYSSPILKARVDSLHGYDIIDHNSINPGLGTLDDFNNFVNHLHQNQMGLLLDIVPNHMGISKNNHWWMDVLENGLSSEYASFFDIDWTPLKKELHYKVLIPILGDHYGNIINNGELRIQYNKDNGKLKLYYYDHEFPINPSSYPLILDYRLDILVSRIGSSHLDYYDYLSIITAFLNLPKHTETDPEKQFERLREKEVAFRRLSELTKRNPLILEFVQENLQDFESNKEDPVSCKRLHTVLENQAYRLAYWRVSSDEINYRRFFDINDLAGLCVDNTLVFKYSHSLILELIEQKKIDGLRIDHPDGLFDPCEYFNRLQFEISRCLNLPFYNENDSLCASNKLPFYIIVEKILAPVENLPENWAVHGTVGYDYLNTICGLFIEKENEKLFTKLYNRFVNKQVNFSELVKLCKKLIMKTSLTGELNVLSNYLNKISENYIITRDYTLNSLREALVEVIANFPVYRTYITKDEKSNKDIDYVKWAVGLAKKDNQSTDPSIFDFIEKVLLLEFEQDTQSAFYDQILEFTMKFQQYTSPLMAKGLEDTTFYRYNRLVALNEVGGEPNHFGTSVNEFHYHNISRLETCPHNMLSTSTHDTKRSEDARVRIAAISELPDEWQKTVNKLSQINRSKKTKHKKSFMPSKNDEYLFYQTLLAIWPYTDVSPEEKELIVNRLENYMLKAIREAKVHTSWVNINETYEEAICSFIRKVVISNETHIFWKEFLPFHRKIAQAGFINSLSQQVLKLTSPGMPDIYQGCEAWSFTLVDPDNRQKIDYDLLSHSLYNTTSLTGKKIHEPVVKQFITAKTLNFRKNNSDIFSKGQYIPFETTGPLANNIVAYGRNYEKKLLIVVAPRLMSKFLSDDASFLIPDHIWKDTKLVLTDEFCSKTWKNLYTDECICVINDREILISEILRNCSVALLQ